MAYIEVEIDLSDFELDDILEELEERYHFRHGKSKKAIDDFIKRMKIDAEPISPGFLLMDQMKIDFFMRNIDKITINELEELIKT